MTGCSQAAHAASPMTGSSKTTHSKTTHAAGPSGHETHTPNDRQHRDTADER